MFASEWSYINLMNKLKIILIIAAFFVIAQTASAAPTLAQSATVRIKEKTLFVFKTDKQFVGATVEVIYANGDVVIAQTLEKRKLVIDFAAVKSGDYMVRVKKGKRIEEFYYEKK
jgi:hypothetical protein